MPAIVDWGLRDYSSALAEMRALVADRRAGRIDDTLVLVEHPPVVTVGIQGDDGSAAASGLPVVNVERGGRATFHGPGQLVGYPIVDLVPRGRDVRGFVRDLELLVARSIAPFGLTTRHVSGQPGVWVDGQRKIASIGIAVQQWVTFHGFALNVAPDLSAFERFRPCGMPGSVMTSLARELGRSVTLAEVHPYVRAAWSELAGPPVTGATRTAPGLSA